MYKNHMLPKILISAVCVLAVLAILLRGDETASYQSGGMSSSGSDAIDGFVFDPEELTYDGSGDLDLLQGVSLPGYTKQELKDLVFVEISTVSALSNKSVEYTAKTKEGRYRSVRKLYLAGYTGPDIKMPANIPDVTPENMEKFGELLMKEEDFFVDDGFGNDASSHMQVDAEKSQADSSIVHYTISIENVFGDRDRVAQDIVLSGKYPVIALTTPTVRLRVGQTFDPRDYIARAERADGSSALDEVMVGGRVVTSEAGEYAMTYSLLGESVRLNVIVE